MKKRLILSLLFLLTPFISSCDDKIQVGIYLGSSKRIEYSSIFYGCRYEVKSEYQSRLWKVSNKFVEYNAPIFTWSFNEITVLDKDLIVSFYNQIFSILSENQVWTRQYIIPESISEDELDFSKTYILPSYSEGKWYPASFHNYYYKSDLFLFESEPVSALDYEITKDTVVILDIGTLESKY